VGTAGAGEPRRLAEGRGDTAESQAGLVPPEKVAVPPGLPAPYYASAIGLHGLRRRHALGLVC